MFIEIQKFKEVFRKMPISNPLDHGKPLRERTGEFTISVEDIGVNTIRGVRDWKRNEENPTDKYKAFKGGITSLTFVDGHSIEIHESKKDFLKRLGPESVILLE